MSDPHPETQERGRSWLGRAGRCIRSLWLPKLIGTPASMIAFFLVYFFLLRHGRSPVTTVPLTFVDRLIPFGPWAFPLYVSLWFYVTLPSSLMDDGKELASYLGAAVALSVTGFAIFCLWPTTVPKPDIDWSVHPTLAHLKTVDASGNAFPSLHVAFAVFTLIELARLLRVMGAGPWVLFLNWLWCLGIVYSTIAVRQHVALDALSGGILGWAVAAIHLRILAFSNARRLLEKAR